MTAEQPTSQRRRSKSGFTLLELMVAVIIVAVLATVAIVSYKRYSLRARTQEATNFLLQVKLKQETYFTTYGHYASATTYPETGFVGGSSSAAPMAWDIDCGSDPDAWPGWCALGVRPAFSACTEGVSSASGQCTYHQFETVGWSPVDAPDPPDGFINSPQRAWWYATATSDLDGSDTNGDGDGTSLWFISSESAEVFNRHSDDI